ncbi:hypothetical protein PMM47T1_28481 [Pseudomonas sp. M47T1]|uniref:hypothetical protein n=1 Tax=Pseudomonas sp. M47T1 TaxID=1179778 RepID=UPI0002608160|nr:hypothetical protein [Pseudomonas sp. M47T1]EIK93135.1 hypothetical protein PMM47T1_28481 [Pseudomonas sp. M47T1]
MLSRLLAVRFFDATQDLFSQQLPIYFLSVGGTEPAIVKPNQMLAKPISLKASAIFIGAQQRFLSKWGNVSVFCG